MYRVKRLHLSWVISSYYLFQFLKSSFGWSNRRQIKLIRSALRQIFIKFMQISTFCFTVRQQKTVNTSNDAPYTCQCKPWRRFSQMDGRHCASRPCSTAYTGDSLHTSHTSRECQPQPRLLDCTNYRGDPVSVWCLCTSWRIRVYFMCGRSTSVPFSRVSAHPRFLKWISTVHGCLLRKNTVTTLCDS